MSVSSIFTFKDRKRLAFPYHDLTFFVDMSARQFGVISCRAFRFKNNLAALFCNYCNRLD